MERCSLPKSDEVLKREGIKSSAHRARILLIASTFGLLACGKSALKTQNDDAAPLEGVALTVPDSYKAFETPEYRVRFASDFSKTLPIIKGSDHFFYPMDYSWKLEEALKQAGQGGEVPDLVFRQTHEAALAHGLQRLFGEWAQYTIPDKNPELYRSPYVQQLYRHYRYLRYLELIPELPERKGAGNSEQLIQLWFERDQKAWQLTQESPFFGVKKNPATAGPLEKPLMPLVQRLKEELLNQCPDRGSEDFRIFQQSKIHSAVLDMILPAMYFEAINQRFTRAGLAPRESGFDPIPFESELKKGFNERSEFFGRYATDYAQGRSERRIMEIVSKKFMEISRLEHPLKLYKTPLNGAVTRD